ncbi:MAG: DEAD/DEAH box helicase [Candidatus Andersenbacteria bacterium]|nr:DEAD/DEAH box helicase [Candidatus Andersenbacteria bacterium]
MSNNAPKKFCQELVAFIDDVLGPFSRAVTQRALRAEPPLALHLSAAQLALFAAHWHNLAVRKFIITDGPPRQAQKLHAAVQNWSDALHVNDAWHCLTTDLTDQENRGYIVTNLSRSYHALLAGTATAHFIIPTSLLTAAIPRPSAYHQQALSLHVGERQPLARLSAALTHAGYARLRAAGDAGTFAVSGESLDIIHPVDGQRYIITLWHNTIERLALITSHRKPGQPHIKSLPSLTMPAVSFPPATMPLSQTLSDACVIRQSHVFAPASRFTITYDAMHPFLDFPLTDATSLQHTLQHKRIWLIYQNRDRAAQLAHQRTNTPLRFCQHILARTPLRLTNYGNAIISEAALAPPRLPSTPISYRRSRDLIRDLSPDQPAVHSDHGIGIYEGLFTKTYGAVTREYLVLRYAAGDSISVPVEYAHKVTPYIGTAAPAIHRLHTRAWAKTKQVAKDNAVQFANDLLSVAARRTAAARCPYNIDKDREAALAASFPYTLTADQHQAWQEVQSDLQRSTPMDRLIIGDVGFGKTEIAVRAARHVVANRRQVAVLAPTTLLTEQHAQTFQRRLPTLDDQIAALSRFTPARTQHLLREKISSGDVKIIIGTHTLLSPRLAWHDLGLVIIDEEQRFGVAHKEHFKKIRATVDVLSLSATPIPRTVSMALSGLKHVSHMNEPPSGRKQIKTYVGPDSDTTIQQAIKQELSRGGQVFVVTPRIRNLFSQAHRIRQLVPGATVAVAHGQLRSRELARVMNEFIAGRSHVLVSSAIIESGLDLPNTNTIIVLNSTAFGLADLYQLRGRIGRRTKLGYAYLLYHQHQLTSLQRQRLTAITEAAQLGSGWALAQRDLELRGAGNLLGAEQSGAIGSIGLQLYLDMVREAGRQARGPVHSHDVDIQLPISAFLPVHYIADAGRRAAAYQNLSRAASRVHLRQELRTVEEHFGPLPAPSRNLYRLLTLQHVAAAAGIRAITSHTIAPPRAAAFQRLTITATKPTAVLARLNTLGACRALADNLTFDVPAINPTLVQKMIRALE